MRKVRHGYQILDGHPDRKQRQDVQAAEGPFRPGGQHSCTCSVSVQFRDFIWHFFLESRGSAGLRPAGGEGAAEDQERGDTD